MLIANVHINRENKGDFFLKRTDKGKMLFSREDLLRLRIDVASTDSMDDVTSPSLRWYGLNLMKRHQLCI